MPLADRIAFMPCPPNQYRASPSRRRSIKEKRSAANLAALRSTLLLQIRLFCRVCLFINQFHHIISERTNRNDSNKDQWDAHARFLLHDSACCHSAFWFLISLYQSFQCAAAKKALRFHRPLLLSIDGEAPQRLRHIRIAQHAAAAKQLGPVV